MMTKKRAAKFIIFAIRQAKEAQAFGFTRNECCRNLKTALHQYWQNKVLGLHSHAQTKRMPRSKAALNIPDKDCETDHGVPQMLIVNRLMEMKPVTESAVIELLTKFYTVMRVTPEEHARLNGSGLRSKMPSGWDESDVYARYHAVGIEVDPH